jgi:glutamate-5-semialdehyde dehydrogenase
MQQFNLNSTLKNSLFAKDSISLMKEEEKNTVLKTIAYNLKQAEKEILKANALDLKLAKEKNLTEAFIDRLTLNSARIDAMVKAVEEIIKIKDPIGKVLESWETESGLFIKKISVPIGLIGIIYESRPNVALDASIICIKSGNCVILRGGSESINSSLAIVNVIRKSLRQNGFNEDIVSAVLSADRSLVKKMLKARGKIDLIIPRGGKNLIKMVIKESKIPLLEHLEGNCFTYIHQDANLDTAIKVTVNAKMRRTGICGATESVVVDEKIASSILPKLAEKLTELGCELRGDDKSRKITPLINKKANEKDYYTEYLAPILSIKVVKNFDNALKFIKKHHSQHTDSIITENKQVAKTFENTLDSAIVMVNTSTQFADGGEFGFGGEIGIATGKMHARGPVSVNQLTTFKYLVESNGVVRK